MKITRLLATGLMLLLLTGLKTWACDDPETTNRCNNAQNASCTASSGGSSSQNSSCEECCESDEKDSGKCESCGGDEEAPVLHLDDTSILVRDTPIWFTEFQGPSFRFRLLYDSLDNRSRATAAWPVGYKWNHSYQARVEKDGNNRRFWVSGVRFYKFTPDGSGGYQEATGRETNEKTGNYFMATTNASTNLVVRDIASGGRYEFGPDGTGTGYRLEKVRDNRGLALNLYYNPQNVLTSIVTAATHQFRFTYSPGGYLTNILDVTGNRTCKLAYSNDLLVSASDMGGQTFLYGYDANGNLTSLKRPHGTGYATTSIAHEFGPSTRHKVTITYPEGNTAIGYWPNDTTNTLRVTNGEGGTTKKKAGTATSWGRPFIEEEDALGNKTTYEYFDNTGNALINGKLKKQVTPDGTITTFSYDAKGRQVLEKIMNSASNVLFYTTNTIAYFTGTPEPQSILEQERDGNGNLLAKRSTQYKRADDNGTSGIWWDDVYVLDYSRTWLSTNAADYTETRYLHNTDELVSAEQVLIAGTNSFRTVWTNSFSAGKLICRQDALTNRTWYVYDITNRLVAVTNAPAGGLLSTVTHKYDLLNRTLQTVYPDGSSESWTHAPCGCGYLTHTNRGGIATAWEYNLNKLISREKITSGNGTVLQDDRYYYNSLRQVTNLVDALGNSQQSVFNAEGQLIQRMDALGRSTTYLRDAMGRTFKTVYPDGTISSNTFNQLGQLVKVSRFADSSATAPLTTDEYTFTANGRRITEEDSLGNVTSNQFNLAGWTLKTTRPDDSYTRSLFDLQGNVTNSIGPVFTAGEEASAKTVSVYDSLDRLIRQIDPAGRTNEFIYSADHPNQVAQTKLSGNPISETAFDILGRTLTNMTYGFTLVYAYNALGNVTNTLYPDGTSASSLYDGTRLIASTDRSGNTSHYVQDAVGRQIAVTNSRGYVTQFAHDPVGNMTNVTDALDNKAKHIFDSMNRRTREIYADGRIALYEFDKLGQQTARKGAGSLAAYYSYDAIGRMTNLMDAMYNNTGFSYSEVGNLEKKTYADGSFYSYAYNSRGWLTNRVDAKGVTTEYRFDPSGLLTNVDYTSDPDVCYYYDPMGRMTQRVDAAGTWAWTYDGASFRASSETLTPPSLPSLPSVQYSYHSNTFELASVSFGPYTTQYAWSEGRLTNVCVSSAPFCGTFSYEYLADSDLLQKTTYLGGTVTVHRAYDALDRLVSITASNTTAKINSFAYALDSTGRRTKRTHMSGGYIDFGYDEKDQLTSAVMTDPSDPAFAAAYNYGYQFDRAGNRLHEDRGQLDIDGAHNNLNQLTNRAFSGTIDVYGTANSTSLTVKVMGQPASMFANSNYWGGAKIGIGTNQGTYTLSVVATNAAGNQSNLVQTVDLPSQNPQTLLWDENGNLTNDGARAYYWDTENRLVAIESLVGEKRRSEYVCDADSRRVKTTDYSGWNGSAYAVTNVTRFIWDGYLVLAEITTTVSGTTTNYNVHGLDLSQSLQGAGGIGGLLAVVSSESSDVQLFTHDGNGNVVDIADGTGGTILAHYEYCPFGRIVRQSGPEADDNPWRFSSQWYEPVWSHCRYVYRIYLPEVGHWLSRDPVTYWHMATLTLFVSNDPASSFDVLGLVDVEYKPPKMPKPQGVKDLTARYRSGGEKGTQGYTTYTPKALTCWCRGCRVKCRIRWTPKIYLLNTLDKKAKWNAKKISWAGALGHEQAHVRACMSQIEGLVWDLSLEEGKFKTSDKCRTAAKEYQKTYGDKLNLILDDTADRHGKDGHPKDGEPMEPKEEDKDDGKKRK